MKQTALNKLRSLSPIQWIDILSVISNLSGFVCAVASIISSVAGPTNKWFVIFGLWSFILFVTAGVLQSYIRPKVQGGELMKYYQQERNK